MRTIKVLSLITAAAALAAMAIGCEPGATPTDCIQNYVEDVVGDGELPDNAGNEFFTCAAKYTPDCGDELEIGGDYDGDGMSDDFELSLAAQPGEEGSVDPCTAGPVVASPNCSENESGPPGAPAVCHPENLTPIGYACGGGGQCDPLPDDRDEG